jgi:hypothetical protein
MYTTDVNHTQLTVACTAPHLSSVSRLSKVLEIRETEGMVDKFSEPPLTESSDDRVEMRY